MKFRTINDGNGNTGILMSNSNQKGEDDYIPRTINIAGTVISNSNQTEAPYVPGSLEEKIPKHVYEPQKGSYRSKGKITEKATHQPNSGGEETPYIQPTFGDISRRV